MCLLGNKGHPGREQRMSRTWFRQAVSCALSAFRLKSVRRSTELRGSRLSQGEHTSTRCKNYIVKSWRWSSQRSVSQRPGRGGRYRLPAGSTGLGWCQEHLCYPKSCTEPLGEFHSLLSLPLCDHWVPCEVLNLPGFARSGSPNSLWLNW